jgi:hypothetical protein
MVSWYFPGVRTTVTIQNSTSSVQEISEWNFVAITSKKIVTRYKELRSRSHTPSIRSPSYNPSPVSGGRKRSVYPEALSHPTFARADTDHFGLFRKSPARCKVGASWIVRIGKREEVSVKSVQSGLTQFRNHIFFEGLPFSVKSLRPLVSLPHVTSEVNRS